MSKLLELRLAILRVRHLSERPFFVSQAAIDAERRVAQRRLQRQAAQQERGTPA